MKPKRIKASDLQFKGYNFHEEMYENTDDTVDLDNEYGTRLKDGTVTNDDIESYDADDHYGLQIINPDDIRG